MRKRSKMIATAGAAAVVAASGAVALAVAPDRGPDASAPVVTDVDQRLTSHFAAFRNISPAQKIPKAAVDRFGSNASLARQALVTPQGNPVFIVPANNVVCVAGDEVGNSCSTIDRAITKPMVSIGICGPTIPRGTVVLSGLVPDGFRDLKIEASDGSSRAAPVTNNVLYVVAPNVTSVPTTVVWTTVNGESGRAPLGAVPTAAAANCA